MLDQAIHFVWLGPAFFGICAKYWYFANILMADQKEMLDLAIQNVWPGPAFFLQSVWTSGILPTF